MSSTDWQMSDIPVISSPLLQKIGEEINSIIAELAYSIFKEG